MAVGPAVALGLARFAYALILPTMRQHFGWSLTTAGVMNTANAVGYMIGAAGAARIAGRVGSRRTFLVSLTVTAAALLVTAVSSGTAWIALFRLVSGLAGGIAFVVGGGLVAQAGAHDAPGRAALLLGIYFGGAGFGIVVSALTVPALLAVVGRAIGWRLAWGVLGGIGMLGLAGAIPATRLIDRPGGAGVRRSQDGWLLGGFWPMLVSYGLYGAGYIVYMTFIIAYFQQRGIGPQDITLFWTLLGLVAMLSGFVWSRLLGRIPGGFGAAGLVVLVLSGVLLPLWSTALAPILGSAVLFGLGFLAVVTAITVVVRRNLAPEYWTGALAGLTVAFGLGQSAGPTLAGYVSSGPDGVRSGLLVSAGILAASAMLAVLQRDDAASPVRRVPSVE
ncbi:MAG: YbfB/YjiJ family MFS transporter [Thermaerobacter sp.]|nr:YbfB/YjiJ family MFS transporter [Thermaerobacter sp.]